MDNKRPVGILRHNAEVMRDNGAPQDVIGKYLADNGSSWQQILAVPSPNQDQLTRMLASEKDGTFADNQAKIAAARESSEQSKRATERLGWWQGATRAVGNGLLFNTADELESAVTGQPVAEIRDEQKQFTKTHPVASIGGSVLGAIANPIGRALPVAKGTLLGSRLLAQSGMGALQGAGYGALYGFGAGEDGVRNRLKEAYRQAKTGAIVGGAIPVVKEGIKATGRLVADVAGTTSGAGGESLKRGFDAGTRNSETYRNAMRGKGSVYDVVDDVDKAVRTMEKNASAKYKAMLPDNGATLKLPDKEFNDALKKATESISGVTSGVDDTAAKAVNKAHTLARNIKLNGGMTFDNALEAKKAMDGIIEPLSRAGEKNAVRILTPIRNALNNTLESAVPEYGGARAAFRADTRLIENIKHALTSSDPTTELRKLQGITRQSVAAAQGGKQELGAVLDAVSNKRILDAVAGGQVQQMMPRDPLRAIAAGGAAFSTHALSANPLGFTTVAAFSPRVLGEAAYYAGRLANVLPNTDTNAILQLVEALKKR